MNILTIVKKDIRLLLSDKQAIAILVLMPMILLTILGFALSGAFEQGSEVAMIHIAIAKEYEDTDVAAYFENLPIEMGEVDLTAIDFDFDKILFEDVLGNEELSKIISYEIVDREKGMQMVEDREVPVFVILPEDFIGNTLLNMATPFRKEVDIEIIADPDANIAIQITNTIFSQLSNQLNHMVSAKSIYLEEQVPKVGIMAAFEGLEELYSQLQHGQSGLTTVQKPVDNRRMIGSTDYYSVAMLSMFLLFAGGQGGRMMLEEKRAYTYQRMNVAGISKWEILIGKFITVYIIGWLQVAVMILYTSLVLKVAWGNLWEILLIAGVGLLTVAAMGTLIGAITVKMDNFKVANMMENFLFQVMAFLGGSFVPLETLPEIFDKISFFTINGLVLKSFLANMQGYDLSAYQINIFILGAIALVFFILAVAILSAERWWRNGRNLMASSKKA